MMYRKGPSIMAKSSKSQQNQIPGTENHSSAILLKPKPAPPLPPVVKAIVNSQIFLLTAFILYGAVGLCFYGMFTADIGDAAFIAVILLVLVFIVCTVMLMRAIQGRKKVKLLRDYVRLLACENITSLTAIASALGKTETQVQKDIRQLTEDYFLTGVQWEAETKKYVLTNKSPKVIDGDANAPESTKIALNCTSCGAPLLVAPGQMVRCPLCFSAVSVNMKKYEEAMAAKKNACA